MLVSPSVQLTESLAHHIELRMAVALEHSRVALAQHLRHEVIRYSARAESCRKRVTQLIDGEVLDSAAFQRRRPSFLEAADVWLA